MPTHYCTSGDGMGIETFVGTGGVGMEVLRG